MTNVKIKIPKLIQMSNAKIKNGINVLTFDIGVLN
jgi:hypothetical protein